MASNLTNRGTFELVEAEVGEALCFAKHFRKQLSLSSSIQESKDCYLQVKTVIDRYLPLRLNKLALFLFSALSLVVSFA